MVVVVVVVLVVVAVVVLVAVVVVVVVMVMVMFSFVFSLPALLVRTATTEAEQAPHGRVVLDVVVPEREPVLGLVHTTDQTLPSAGNAFLGLDHRLDAVGGV